MPWDWTPILESLPAEKRGYYESLRYQAEALPALPTIQKKSITVHYMNIDSVFLKAFEESYDRFDKGYFESRFKRLKNHLGTSAENYLVYFPGTNLYFYDKDTNLYCGKFRIVARTYDGDQGFLGA